MMRLRELVQMQHDKRVWKSKIVLSWPHTKSVFLTLGKPSELIWTDWKYHVVVLFLTSLISFAELLLGQHGSDRAQRTNSLLSFCEFVAQKLWYIFVYSFLHNYLLSCHVVAGSFYCFWNVSIHKESVLWRGWLRE